MKNNIKIVSLASVLSFFVLSVINCFAGNLNLIEDRLKELDELNKRTVKEAVNIPQSGVVFSTLDISPGKGKEAITVKELNIESKEKNTLKRPYTIQINSSNNRERIIDIAKKLNDAGIPSYVSTPFQHKGKKWWRLFIGWYETYEQAEKANTTLYENKFPQGFIIKLPYSIMIGKNLSNQHSSKVYNTLIKKGYVPYTMEDKQEKKRIILLGAYKTIKEAEATLVSLTGLDFEKYVVSR